MKIGYKVFSKTMHSMDNDGDRDYVFQEDTEYEIPDYAHIIFQGFIFYKNLEEVAKYHLLDPSINRICRIKILGEEESIRDVHFTTKIKLIREISEQEIKLHFAPRVEHIMCSGDEELQIRLVQSNLCLDKLIHSSYPNIRAAVARQGYRLDYLVHDSSSLVRYEVASKGYGLDILSKDYSPMVRRAVEEQGYDNSEENERIEMVFRTIVSSARERLCATSVT